MTRLSIKASSLAIFCSVVMAGAVASGQSVQPSASPSGNVALDSVDHSEDLDELSLKHSNLQAAPPLPGGTAGTATFIREFYQMQWRRGDPIDTYVVRPKGVSKPPVIIYLYGYPSGSERFRNDAFCELITRKGIAAVGFAPALTGERFHSVPMRNWFVSDLHDSVVKTVHDIQMIVNYIASRKDLDGTRIGIFGQGAGATIAGLAAAQDPRIQAIDLLDPWGDWPVWMAQSKIIPDNERADLIKTLNFDQLAPLDPVNWLPALNSRPLKLDDALYENNTPAAAKSRIEASLPASAQLVRYPTRSDFEKNAIAEGKLIAWLQERLLTVAPKPAKGAADSELREPARFESARRDSAKN